jgi:hypothetical protein
MTVAVAVTNSPANSAELRKTLIDTVPEGSVVTSEEPKNRLPSPLPEGSHSELAKNSMRKSVFGTLERVPTIVTWLPFAVAESRTGKF